MVPLGALVVALNQEISDIGNFRFIWSLRRGAVTKAERGKASRQVGVFDIKPQQVLVPENEPVNGST